MLVINYSIINDYERIIFNGLGLGSNDIFLNIRKTSKKKKFKKILNGSK